MSKKDKTKVQYKRVKVNTPIIALGFNNRILYIYFLIFEKKPKILKFLKIGFKCLSKKL